MIKILHRYILKEFIGSFCFGLIIFSAILLLDQIFQLVDLFYQLFFAVQVEVCVYLHLPVLIFDQNFSVVQVSDWEILNLNKDNYKGYF